MSHFVSPDTGRSFELFGSAKAVEEYGDSKGIPLLGRIPLQPDVSSGGDRGQPTVLRKTIDVEKGDGVEEMQNLARGEFLEIARKCWHALGK